MRRVAIFVEGQTELIFVREFLLKYHDYQDISIECYTLFTDSKFIPTEYAFLPETSDQYFQLINVGNDKSVISRMLSREKFLRNAGFDLVVGLRDLYSKEYRETAKNHSIDWAIIEKFKVGHRSQIKADLMNFCFAIMETEAWMLGFNGLLAKIDPILSYEYIAKELGVELGDTDPEATLYHPSNTLKEIFMLAGKKPYDKSKGDVSSFVSLINREDYMELLSSDKCKSFKEFKEALNI